MYNPVDKINVDNNINKIQKQYLGWVISENVHCNNSNKAVRLLWGYCSGIFKVYFIIQKAKGYVIIQRPNHLLHYHVCPSIYVVS